MCKQSHYFPILNICYIFLQWRTKRLYQDLASLKRLALDFEVVFKLKREPLSLEKCAIVTQMIVTFKLVIPVSATAHTVTQ